MMLEKIRELLAASGADAWELTETKTEGWEFYLIRHRLDQNRLRETTHITVKVYRRIEEEALGSASEEIPSTATEEEIREILKGLLSRASYVKNPYYTLGEPQGEAPSGAGSSPLEEAGETDAASQAEAFLHTLAEIPETPETDLNSCEIFVNAEKRRFLNSRGIDVHMTGLTSLLEVVVNARDEEREIELYRIYESGSCDRETITSRIRETMQFGRDRLKAVPMPKLGSSAVVFSTAEGREICDFFISRMSASFKGRGYSDWEIGEPILKGAMKTRIRVEAVKTLPNSSGNAPYDPEGAPIRDEVMIEDGVPVKFLGDRQFSCYLNLMDSFIPGNYRVSGGDAGAEELRRGDFLEAVEFSDLQVDPLSGNLAGEIRLAYWHHGGTVTPVTGGSISGNMLTLAETMRMSRELRQYDRYEIPAVIRLEDVSVTGIEEPEG